MTNSKTIDDGGPAFPNNFDSNNGISLRDWFAGQVIVLMIHLYKNTEGEWSNAIVSNEAYALADDMLKARQGRIAMPDKSDSPTLTEAELDRLVSYMATSRSRMAGVPDSLLHKVIAVARLGLRVQQLHDSGADLDAIADALKHPNAPDKPSPTEPMQHNQFATDLPEEGKDK